MMSLYTFTYVQQANQTDQNLTIQKGKYRHQPSLIGLPPPDPPPPLWYVFPFKQSQRLLIDIF